MTEIEVMLDMCGSMTCNKIKQTIEHPEKAKSFLVGGVATEWRGDKTVIPPMVEYGEELGGVVRGYGFTYRSKQ